MFQIVSTFILFFSLIQNGNAESGLPDKLYENSYNDKIYKRYISSGEVDSLRQGVVMIMNDGYCTAAVVGTKPLTLITARHCLEQNSVKNSFISRLPKGKLNQSLSRQS